MVLALDGVEKSGGPGSRTLHTSRNCHRRICRTWSEHVLTSTKYVFHLSSPASKVGVSARGLLSAHTLPKSDTVTLSTKHRLHCKLPSSYNTTRPLTETSESLASSSSCGSHCPDSAWNVHFDDLYISARLAALPVLTVNTLVNQYTYVLDCVDIANLHESSLDVSTGAVYCVDAATIIVPLLDVSLWTFHQKTFLCILTSAFHSEVCPVVSNLLVRKSRSDILINFHTTYSRILSKLTFASCI